MKSINIRVITLGHMPPLLELQPIASWKSQLFQLDSDIENIHLSGNSDLDDWQYSDSFMKSRLPQMEDEDFLFAITNVPLEDNYYSRRLGDNQIVFTLHDIQEILSHYQIPLNNAVLRLLYSYSLVFKRNGNKLPDMGEATNYTHEDTRGCLFDLNPNKIDIIQSCVDPIICDECVQKLKDDKVSSEVISSTKREISKIKQKGFIKFKKFIENHPKWSLALNSIYTIILGTVGSILFKNYFS